MMTEHTHGFDLEVNIEDDLPHVLISNHGEVVLDTNRLSIKGLENMSEVLKRAASLANQFYLYNILPKH